MATEYELSINDYLAIMRRRAPYMTGAFGIVFLISLVFTFSIPPTYRSTGTIMVESKLIPENMVPNVNRNQLTERINVIRQRVMTRENLMKIANKFGLFKENSGSLTSSELIDKLKDRIEIESISTSRQGQPATAFSISFEDKHPEIALQVTNDLVTLFLDWNVKLLTESATETTAFLTQESDKLKLEVDRLERVIAEFKRKNSSNLPEQLNLRTSMLARAENDLYEVERDIRSSNETLRSLEAELSAAKHGMSEENQTQTLPALRAEYTRLSAIYTQSHPDIKALKRKIDALEHAPDKPNPNIVPDDASNLEVYMIQARVDTAKARIDSLTKQKEMLKNKIAQNEHAMMLTPKVAQELDAILRERDNAQKKYEEILNKKMNAKIAESMESESKSERLSLLDPPIFPDKPYKPNRKKYLVMGLFLALFSAGGAITVMESIDRRIRGTEALSHVLGYQPLVVVPYLTNKWEVVRRKRILKRIIIAAIVAMIVTILAIHLLYMPLDILITNILLRIT